MKPDLTPRVLLLCLVLLGGAVPQATPGPAVAGLERAPAASATPAERFFHYFHHVRTLSPDALRQERARQDRAFTEDRSPENRLRLALVLSLPGQESNRPYALDLLQRYLWAPEPASADFVDVAAFLVTFIQDTAPPPPPPPLADPQLKHLQTELQEKERLLAAQQQRIKKLQEELDAQRSIQATLSKQVQDTLRGKERQQTMVQQLNKKLQDERRNVKRLQDKIEKIKDIEKSLMDRERTDNKGT